MSSSANNRYLVFVLLNTAFRLFVTPFSLVVTELNSKLVGSENSILLGFWIDIKISCGKSTFDGDMFFTRSARVE